MPLSNYGELKTSVASWLNRTDLTSTIPDLITLGQARVWQDLIRLGGASVLEDEVSGTTTGTITLPTNFGSMRTLKATVNGKEVDLRPISPTSYNNYSGVPFDYYLTGTTAVLSPSPDGTYDYRALYYAKATAFSADGDTDTILTKTPHLYLYSALLEAQPFLMDDARAQGWMALYNERLSAAVLLDKTRYGNMMIRADRVGG